MNMRKNAFVFFIAAIISMNMFANNDGVSQGMFLKGKGVFPEIDKRLFVSTNIARDLFWDYNLGVELKGNDIFSYTLGFGYYAPKTYKFSSMFLNHHFEHTTTEPGASIYFQFRQYFVEVFRDLYWLTGVSYNSIPVVKHFALTSGVGFFYAPVDLIALSVETGANLIYRQEFGFCLP
jgi:hypothetical protein